jgi:DNA polymerase III subunit epsilon
VRPLDSFIYKLTQRPMFHKEFFAKMRTFKELEYVDVEDISMLRLLGLPLVKYNDVNVTLETLPMPLSQAKFCIVDIESNGSKPEHSQIIEIGAVMIQGDKELGRFSSLIYCEELPEVIANLTGITAEELLHAPAQKSVLEAFRLFLGDAIFVAHNVNFDYYFISYAMQKAGFGPLLNRKLCTIDLSRKCIVAPKYGLSALMEHFQEEFESHHRALCDALATKIVLLKSLEALPEAIKTVEALIDFSKPQGQKKKKKPKPTDTSS